MAGVTLFGNTLSARQHSCIQFLLAVAKQERATTPAAEAMVFAAAFESTFGIGLVDGNHIGPLQAQSQYYPGLAPSDPILWRKEVVDFLHGNAPFGAGGALKLTKTEQDIGKVAARVEVAWLYHDSIGGNGYGQYFNRTEGGKTGQALMDATKLEAATIVSSMGGGGFFNQTLGTTPKSNPSPPFFVGGPSNPNEDVWTAINRLAQERYWYLFSDGEVLYLADGIRLLDQPPVLKVDRWKNNDRIVHLDFTWDNTAYQYAITHKKKGRAVRKTQVTKVQSPVESTLQYICNIDEVRAGDVVQLSNCGPGDGNWLVAETRRSIFQIYTEMTLVPAVKALSESQANNGLNNTSNADVPGAAATQPGAGTIMNLFQEAAATIAGPNNFATPYVHDGGHQSAGIPDIGDPGGIGYDGTTQGFDAAGAVAAVFSAAGLWPKQGVPEPNGVISTLQTEGFLLPGLGSGTPQVTVFINRQYFFMRMTGPNGIRYFGTADGVPIKVTVGRRSTSNTNLTTGNNPRGTAILGSQTTVTKSQTGGSWLDPPSDLSAFKAYHVPPTLLGQLSGNVGVSASIQSGGAYVNPFGQATIVAVGRIDSGVDYHLTPGDPILALGDGVVEGVYRRGVDNSGWPGAGTHNLGGYVSYKLTSPPYAGKIVYVAEEIEPVVSSNSSVIAGQKIATYVGGTSNLETGWASGVGTLAKASQAGQASEATSSAYGFSFNNLLKSLHCEGGTPHSSPVGTVEPGYPNP